MEIMQDERFRMMYGLTLADFGEDGLLMTDLKLVLNSDDESEDDQKAAPPVRKYLTGGYQPAREKAVVTTRPLFFTQIKLKTLALPSSVVPPPPSPRSLLPASVVGALLSQMEAAMQDGEKGSMIMEAPNRWFTLSSFDRPKPKDEVRSLVSYPIAIKG